MPPAPAPSMEGIKGPPPPYSPPSPSFSSSPPPQCLPDHQAPYRTAVNHRAFHRLRRPAARSTILPPLTISRRILTILGIFWDNFLLFLRLVYVMSSASYIFVILQWGNPFGSDPAATRNNPLVMLAITGLLTILWWPFFTNGIESLERARRSVGNVVVEFGLLIGGVRRAANNETNDPEHGVVTPPPPPTLPPSPPSPTGGADVAESSSTARRKGKGHARQRSNDIREED
ncbi:hypothetical protein TWF696_002895 [Orbilia brochopaga]|uniref:Uncharacterized protein n=1 Tax=Orbilia brochopaga TaxID=3140254 RepID=A0AAV9U4T0_9PEZI